MSVVKKADKRDYRLPVLLLQASGFSAMFSWYTSLYIQDPATIQMTIVGTGVLLLFSCLFFCAEKFRF